MLYYANAKLATDGAVMVTGSHNPPDYNGFKMVLGGKPFYGEQIRALGGQAAAGDVVDETVAPERNVDVAADYVARVLADWDGGDRMLKVVWDNGNGAAGDVLDKTCRRTARRAHRAERHDRRHVPGASSGSRRCRRTSNS